MTTTSTQQTNEGLSPDGDAPDAGDDAAGGAPTTESDAGDQATLPLDHVFESLKNSRRRQVLRYLENNEGGAAVGELAEHVAAIENDTTVRQLSSQQRKRVYVGLYQCHLPKLDDKDAVEYDDDRGTVELGPNASDLLAYLDVADGEDEATDDRPWPKYYLGIAGSAVVALTLAAVLASGATLGVAATMTSLGFVAGVAGLSLVHARSTA